MEEAICCAYHDLEGDYAFIVGQRDDDRLYALKKGSGLVVGVADNATCVSSDLPSVLPLTRRIVRVRGGELVVLTSDGVSLRLVEETEGWSGSGPRRRSTRDSLLDCRRGLGPVAGGGTEQDPQKNGGLLSSRKGSAKPQRRPGRTGRSWVSGVFLTGGAVRDRMTHQA
jgi:hypothetical protein